MIIQSVYYKALIDYVYRLKKLVSKGNYAFCKTSIRKSKMKYEISLDLSIFTIPEKSLFISPVRRGGILYTMGTVWEIKRGFEDRGRKGKLGRSDIWQYETFKSLIFVYL